ncbi:MAG: hypothetical protein AB7Q92_06645 [Acidimicrobiia bacterium]
MVGVDEPDELRRRVLAVIAAGADPTELGFELAQAQRRGAPDPGQQLLDLAADAFLLVGATREAPLELDRVADVHLADRPVRGNAARQKRRYALNAAVLIAAGARPEDTSWWRLDDLLFHAWDALEAFIRAAAEARGSTVADICAALAARS